MATAPRKGLNRARKLGSGPDDQGVSNYTIASGYSTALGVGDLVKLTGTLDNIAVGANSAYNLGVLVGVQYFDSNTNREMITDYWPASQTSTVETPKALVIDDPNATFHIICSNPLGDMVVGNFFPLTLGAPDSSTHRSTMTLNNTASTTGTLAITGTNNAALTALENGDAFAVSTSVNTTPVTITIVTNQTPAQLLALINAVPGVKASLNGSSYLKIEATDGGNLILTDGAGTPIADSNTFLGQTTTATINAYKAKSASAVKVLKLLDTVNNVVEVCLCNHELANNR